jgi:putative ABC transport system substrate-binding protein
MDRRTFIGTVAVGVLAAPFAATAQPEGKVHRIGYLASGSAENSKSAMAPFEQRLRDLGYVEGKNIVIERRYADLDYARGNEQAAELVRLGMDIIVAPATGVAHAAKNATQSIPIVMAATDPVATGLVASLARPGGNVTGFTNIAPEVTAKQVELLREMRPHLGRVAVLVNPANPSTTRVVAEAEAGARRFGVRIQVVKVRAAGDLEVAFAEMARERAEALLVQGDPLLRAARARITSLATRQRLPQIYVLRDHVDAGGLMAYGASYPDLLRRAAGYVDKILRGAQPGDLPVEQPTKFELVINLKTAKALGLIIPQSLLVRADEVIR